MMGGFPGSSDGKEIACNAGDPGAIPGLGRSPGEGYPHQYSCLENPRTEEPGGIRSRGVAKKLDMTEQQNSSKK